MDMLGHFEKAVHFEQDAKDHCGPACAAMYLLSRDNLTFTQRELFDEYCHAFGSDMSTTPEGLIKTIMQRQGNGTDTPAVAVYATEGELSQKICTELKGGNTPIVLVNAGSHWLIVTGAMVRQQPAGKTTSEFAIDSVFVNDPAVSRSKITPNAPLFQVASYFDWQQEFVRRGAAPGEVSAGYAGCFVAICNSFSGDVDICKKLQPSLSDTTDATTFAATTKEAPDIKAAAEHALKNEACFGVDPLKSLQGTVEFFATRKITGTHAQPHDTWLVAFTRKTAQHHWFAVPLIMRIDATDVTFRGATMVPTGSMYLSDDYDVEKNVLDPSARSKQYMLNALSNNDLLIEYLVNRPETQDGFFLQRDSDGRITERLPIDARFLKKDFYWEPCVESLTPYLPFFVFEYAESSEEREMESERGAVRDSIRVFVRLDGEIFWSLTPASGI